MELRPLAPGAPHQLRRHLAAAGHPLLGDGRYGGGGGASRRGRADEIASAGGSASAARARCGRSPPPRDADALSGTTALDRLRADVAADARAAAREEGGSEDVVAVTPTPQLVPRARAAPGTLSAASRRRRPSSAPRLGAPADEEPPPPSPWTAGLVTCAPPRRAARRPSAAASVSFDLSTHLDDVGTPVATRAATPAPTPMPRRAAPRRAAPSHAGAPRPLLWASAVSLTHPATGELLTVASPPPAGMA